VPSWSGGPKAVANARAETVAVKPWFRDAFRRGRCLLPADGFYEWKGAKGTKQPSYYRLRGGGVFAFAGLWDRWQGLETCAVVTTAANALVRPVHPRMPVILGVDAYDRWLDPEANPQDLLGLLRPYPAAAMEAYPVSTRVNRSGNDGPELVEPVATPAGLW
jgi:putative SOS response-associated peptidase YedK